MKARLQAEEMLKTSWRMVQDKETPANVRADLIKATVRWAGLEPKPSEGGGGEAPFQIVFQMGS
jgi:hypothetical protein